MANRFRNIPHLNMEYHMLYVDSKKSVKVRREKKLIISCTYNSNSMYINWNSIIALIKLKLSNGSKKLPKLHMNQSMSSSAYTKILRSNPNSIITLTPNLTESFSTLRFFFWDTLVCKHHTWQIVWNMFNFDHSLYVWYHEI